MFPVSILFVVVGAVVTVTLLLIGAALFSPLVFTVDSMNWQVRVRWLAAVEYWRPLPGGRGETGMSVGGKAFALPAGRRKRKRIQMGTGGKKAMMGRFARRCFGNSSIRPVLAAKARELARGMLRSVSVTCRQICVSLPDPAMTGMLAGWLAQWGGHEEPSYRINFTGENGVLLVGRFYPHRVIKVLLFFLAGLPYRALYREWRGSSAIG